LNLGIANLLNIEPVDSVEKKLESHPETDKSLATSQDDEKDHDDFEEKEMNKKLSD